MNAFAPVSQELVHRIGWTLVHSTWEGVLIAAGLAIALRLLRDSAATKRYAASCLAMALIVAAAGVTFELSGQTPSPPSTPIAQRAAPLAPSPQLSAAPAPLPIAIQPIQTPHCGVLDYLVIAWSVGVVMMAIWHIGGWLWLLRLRRGKPIERYQPVVDRLARRLGIRRVIRLLETCRLDVPAVIGVLRPVILIPLGVLNDLSPQQIEAILAHELAHVRRHDYLVNLLQAVIETLLFYHPAVWWISNRMRAERENCCDDIAADLCGDKRTYAAALAALESGRGLAFKLVPAATGGELLARVRRLLQSASPAPRGYARSVAIVSIVILILTGAIVGWSLLRSPREHTVDLAKGDKRTIDVLVEANALLYQGEYIDWPQLEAKIAAIPPDQRRVTTLAVAASAGDVTVARYFDVSNHLSALVNKYGLAYLSQTGIKPAAPAVTLPPGTEVGEYYMSGHIRRGGVYNLSARKITLQQALVAAGDTEAGFENAKLFVIRRTGDAESIPVDNVSVSDILSGHGPSFFLKANDIVCVGVAHPTTSTAPSAIVGPPPDPSQPGEYYMDGHANRTGVYNMTARKITLKQAIAAAGGVDGDPASLSITIIRRTGADKSSIPLEHASVADLMEGRIPDMYLWPNDVIRISPNLPPGTTQAATNLVAPPPTTAPAADHRAQLDQNFENPSPVTPADLKVQKQDYRIGPLDVLKISVTDLMGPGIDTVANKSVSAAGEVSLLQIGKLKIAGMTVSEAEKAIQKSYHDANLAAGQIKLAVVFGGQGRFSILGDLKKPGEYIISKADFRLLDALKLAEPYSTDDDLRVVRKADQRVIKIDFAKLTAGDASQNVVIRPGDMIIVPMPIVGEYRVAGQVRQPGVFPIGRHLTLRTAIDSVGLEKDVPDPHIRITRRINDRQTTIIDVRYSDLVSGKVEDPVVEPNDDIKVMTELPPATRPATTRAASVMSIEEIAAVDETMREYVKTRDALEFRLAQLSRHFGDGNRNVIDTKADLDFQKQRIDQYAAEFRKHFVGIRWEEATVIPMTSEMESQLKARQNPPASAPSGTTPATTQSSFGSTTQPAAAATGKEYYIDGYISRAGKYAMAAKAIPLRRAIAAAGEFDKDWENPLVEILRIVEGKESMVALVRFGDIAAGRADEPMVQAGDVIHVGVGLQNGSATARSSAGLSLEDIAKTDAVLRDLLNRRAALRSQITAIRQRSPHPGDDRSLSREDLRQLVELMASDHALTESIQQQAWKYQSHLGPIYRDHAKVVPLMPHEDAAPASKPEQSSEVSPAPANPMQRPPATRPFALGAAPALPTVVTPPATGGAFEQGGWMLEIGIGDGDAGARNRSWDFFDARTTAAPATQSLKPTVGQIARADATMRDYLLQRDELAIQLSEAKLHAGNDPAKLEEKTAALDAMDRRIKEYAETYRAGGSPSTQPATSR